jgi:hypothetical protein
MRQHELAVGAATGASRWRLMRYHLSEALGMAVLGGSFASAVLFGGPVIVAWAFEMWARRSTCSRPIRGWSCSAPPSASPVWCWAVAGASIQPAPHRRGAQERLRWERTASRPHAAVHRSGASRSCGPVPRHVRCADVGFTPRGLYAARVNLSAIARTDEPQRLFVRTVEENLAHAPGVASVSIGDGVPLDFVCRNVRVARDGESAFVTAHTTRIAPGYLAKPSARVSLPAALLTRAIEGAQRVARGAPSDPSMRRVPQAIADGLRTVSAQADPNTVFR